jgi:hypothetical protein
MLSSHEYIISKQIQWAMNRDIPLKGSKGERGRPAYTPELNMNLFWPLIERVRVRFEQGNGNEIIGSADSPAKMQAVHSSSALGVNIFQYWEGIHQVPVIAAACGFCDKGELISEKIIFEDKYHIKRINRIPPNIDVVIHNSDLSKFKRFAIECKFSEAYGTHKPDGLKAAYLSAGELWEDVPELHKLAGSISPDNTIDQNLDTAQLIKHILGLKTSYDKGGFKLLYLWYDVLGQEGAMHRDEIEKFTKIALSDGIYFSAISYQELILSLANDQRQEHPEYVKYLTERYL